MGQIINENFQPTEESPEERTANLVHFRDQVNVRYDESIPVTEPSKIEPVYDTNRALQKALNPKYDKDTPLEEIQKNLAKEEDEHQKSFASDVNRLVNESDRRIEHQRALDSNEEANKGFNNLRPLSDTGKKFFENQDVYKEKEEQRTEIEDLKNNLEVLKLQISMFENRIKELENQNSTTPIVEPEPVVEPVEPEPLPIPVVVTTPENSNTDRSNLDKERRDRNLRRAGIIASGVAGAVAGGALSIALSTSTPGGTIIGSFALGIAAKSANSGLQYFQNRETRLKQQLSNTEDQNEKTRIERRLRFATTMRTAMTYVKPFLIGAGIGFAVTSIAQIPIGGESLIHRVGDIFNPDASSIDTVASQIPGQNSLPDTQQVTQTEVPLGGTEVPDSVLVENGRVNLEGSAWNSNLAGQPQGNLPGEAFNHSNYVGGVHEMAPNLAEQALKQAGVTRQMLMNHLGTNGTHQLLNGFVDAIQMGNPNPTLTEVLSRMNNEGARNLLNLIGK
ncbi:MAG: hypothetical protein UR34_C0001G0002 [candidate division WS6 bacterium GW2011_GWC1_33_20]|nr:MAG: hypothetical protein UR32_C0003G0046 [candidate division WS6 bacterium GW2011_GWE2_33_157]KKP44656.1 MAG: hypothetical protein UR34_C0001G0002 [candidate division WS6 bacterium GW2011_GWC1_33_20]KKP46004.1 MAG: hypothetical protein UR36_C0002G0046 [candidate division WS6 bacterium GW2011_GWF1_33_233]KKP55565.1 MAG: hypothetical protein UR45_C0001G0047 [candidate division WS6 bacterium GW2011_WS6_33_547]